MNIGRGKALAAGLLVAGVAAIAGYGIARYAPAQYGPIAGTVGTAPAGAAAPTAPQRRILYWYDPMKPAQHFEKSGKSPYMDMALVPRYADDADVPEPGAAIAGSPADVAPGAPASIRIDPALAQNLGVRIALVERGDVAQALDVPGTVVASDRLTAIVQARAAGFVVRTHARATSDVVAREAALVDLLVPEWAAAQGEFLALLASGEPDLVSAARQRLVLLGMPAALVADIESTRRARAEITVTAPIAGVIDSLDARAGMAVSQGTTLAKIQGLDPIWVEAALPENAGSQVETGASAAIRTAAYPGAAFAGRVVGVLPVANSDSHTLRVRIELPNPGTRLKPGMFAQVQLSAAATRAVLLVPTEAIIRTGTRDLVVVEISPGRYRPTEVRIGVEYGARTEVLAGVVQGQRVVASGQFLIDSEASLLGIDARLLP